MIDDAHGRGKTNQSAVLSAPETAAAVLSAKLTSLLTLVDRFDEGRAAALSGLAKVRPEDSLQAAQLQFLLSELEFQDHRFDEALAASHTAVDLIGACGPGTTRSASTSGFGRSSGRDPACTSTVTTSGRALR